MVVVLKNTYKNKTKLFFFVTDNIQLEKDFAFYQLPKRKQGRYSEHFINLPTFLFIIITVWFLFMRHISHLILDKATVRFHFCCMYFGVEVKQLNHSL